jgi:hypothetical protein
MGMDIDDFKIEKKRTNRKVAKVMLVWLVIFGGLIGYGIYWLFYDWSRFKQELIGESTSPNGTYTINAYLNNGHATTPFTVLGELIFNEGKNRPIKVYWDKTDHANIEWLDEDTVKINNIILELPHESYDYRSGIK